MKVKKRRVATQPRDPPRADSAELTRTRVTHRRAHYDTLLTYASTFAASATTSWRAAVAAVSGVPALTTPNFGDHAASTT